MSVSGVHRISAARIRKDRAKICKDSLTESN